MLATILKQTKRSFREIELKLIELKLRAFQPKVVFALETENFELKTVESVKELRSVLELRHEVFLQERFGFSDDGCDFDRYDLMADHLLLTDKSTGLTVATYRLLCSEFTEEFYSQRQFDLGEFPSTPGTKLELGRACVRKEYRDGRALNAIWKGIGRYAKLTGAKYVFGCGSVRNTDPVHARALHSYLWRKAGRGDFHVLPRWPYIFKSLPENVDEETIESVHSFIPTLLRTYIHAGAKVFSEPSFDAGLCSTDFWMMLNLNDLSSRFRQRYF